MILKQKIQSILSHAGFKKYFFNTGWLMLDKVLRMFLGLFVGVWVARYLGPANYGVLSFALSFVGLFGAFSKLGLDSIIVRNIVKEPDNRDEILGTSLFLKILGSIILLISVYSALQFVYTTPREKLIVMIIAFGQLFMSFEVIDFYFQSQVKAKYSGITSVFGLIVSSTARVIFILLKLPLIWFAFAVVIEQLIKAIFFILFYINNKLNIFKWKFSFNMAKILLKDSWPLILSGMAISIYMKIDQVMIKEMLDNEAVGQYAAAVKLSTAWYFLPVVISNSLFPAIINAKKKSEELYYARLQKLYDLMVWLAIAIALPVTFLSDWIVNILFGSEYSQAANVLRIHIWAGVFVGIAVVKGKWQISENLTKYHFYGAFISSVSNVVFNYIFIPKYEIIGAAYGTILSQFISAYLINYFFIELKNQNRLIHRTINLIRILK